MISGERLRELALHTSEKENWLGNVVAVFKRRCRKEVDHTLLSKAIRTRVKGLKTLKAHQLPVGSGPRMVQAYWWPSFCWDVGVCCKLLHWMFKTEKKIAHFLQKINPQCLCTESKNQSISPCHDNTANM